MSIVYAKLLLMALFWGGTFVAGRIVSQDVGPFSAAFLRFALASACLLALTLCKERGLPRLRPPQVLAVLVLGLTGVFAYNVLFFEGLKTVPAGRAAVIVTCNPIFTALAAAIVFREPLTRWKIAGILLSVSGAVLAITKGEPWRILSDSITWGDAAFLGCITVWVIYSLVGKRMLRDISPLAAVTWASLVGTAALLIPAWNEGLWSIVGHTPPPGLEFHRLPGNPGHRGELHLVLRGHPGHRGLQGRRVHQHRARVRHPGRILPAGRTHPPLAPGGRAHGGLRGVSGQQADSRSKTR